VGFLAAGVWQLGCVAYVAGIVWGFLMTDARSAARVDLALLWPIGPLAFIGTVTILLAVSLVAAPAFGAAVLLASTGVWWALW
jgi:hypothetical protein